MLKYLISEGTTQKVHMDNLVWVWSEPALFDRFSQSLYIGTYFIDEQWPLWRASATESRLIV